jgi:hypothetical protein
MKGIHCVLFCTCEWIIIYTAVCCHITHTEISQELDVILKCHNHHMQIGCGTHPSSHDMGAKVKVLWCLGTLNPGAYPTCYQLVPVLTWLCASLQFQHCFNTPCSTPDFRLHPDFRSGVLETICHA